MCERTQLRAGDPLDAREARDLLARGLVDEAGDRISDLRLISGSPDAAARMLRPLPRGMSRQQRGSSAAPSRGSMPTSGPNAVGPCLPDACHAAESAFANL